ncbi:MAG: NAD(P)-dependent oxidoreductase [Bacteroidales bacterium]|nr:NAD(P)-dependent oxidoreductase [Bacteroidales bacterium]
MTGRKKNIWIFGGTGFIGKALVKYLSNSEDCLLHLLVHKNIPYRFLEPFSVYTGSLEKFDLSWMEKYPPDIIFHLARLGGSNAISRRISSAKGKKANQRLIQFLPKLKTSPVIVYVSGSLMYGNQKNESLANENSELNPISYARYYYRAEEPWLKAQLSEQLDIRFARPGWIIGQDSWFLKFYWEPYIRSRKIPLYGDGSQLMSLIYLNDCVTQIVNLAEKGQRNQNLNIFSGTPISQKNFAEFLAKRLNTDVVQFPVSKLTMKYGKTITEALTSSIPLTTNYPELNSSDSIYYPDLQGMIEKVISFFENIK